MRARKPGRYLAPLAIVAVIAAIALVVRAGIGHSHQSTARTSAILPANRHPVSHRRFYVVRPGDSLSVISVRTGVPVPTLEALNPSINPDALQAGQRLRLRP